MSNSRIPGQSFKTMEVGVMLLMNVTKPRVPTPYGTRSRLVQTDLSERSTTTALIDAMLDLHSAEKEAAR